MTTQRLELHSSVVRNFFRGAVKRNRGSLWCVLLSSAKRPVTGEIYMFYPVVFKRRKLIRTTCRNISRTIYPLAMLIWIQCDFFQWLVLGYYRSPPSLRFNYKQGENVIGWHNCISGVVYFSSLHYKASRSTSTTHYWGEMASYSEKCTCACIKTRHLLHFIFLVI